MSKRNFILLIIALIVVIVLLLGFFYFNKETAPAKEDTNTNFWSQFNPFGNAKPKPPIIKPPVIIPEQPPITEEETPKVKLIKISSMPIAGYTVFLKERLKDIPILTPPIVTPRENTTPVKEKTNIKPTPPPTEFVGALRYVAKSTGNIYQTFVDKIEERKFSTTIVPHVYEAYFGNKGQSVMMRYLKTDDRTIETFVGNLPKEYLGADTTANNEIKGSFLPNNIQDISVSPDTIKIFYLFINESTLGDEIIGTTLNLGDNKKVQIFDSPFTEWLSSWPDNGTITLSTKPSANIPGYMYSLDPIKKNFIKILGGINGLTTLTSPNGKLILFSDNNVSLNLYHIDTRNSDILGIKTLPEKCIWGKVSDVIYCAVPKSLNTGEYPDTWYQGEVSFSDQIWKVDIKTGNATLLIDPITVAGGEDIDGIKLSLGENENNLFFVNKKDSFLWKFDLK